MSEISKESQLGPITKESQTRRKNKKGYRKSFYNPKWQRFRRHFLEGKENWEGRYKCVDCTQEFETIDLHHIVFRSRRPDLIYVEENIALLCRICHNKRHGIKVK